jgi:3-isopropylmalate dehydratase small subunit
MAKHMKVIKMIEWKLGGGDMNTQQIKEYINANTFNGIGTHALNNILSKNKQFEKKGQERIGGITGSSYKVTIWGLNHGL